MFIDVEVFASVDRFTTCTPADKFVEIKVTAKATSEPQRLIWILASPRAEVIQLPPGDTVLRDKILDIFKQIADSGVEVNAEQGFLLETLFLTDLPSIKPDLTLGFPDG